MKTKEPMDIQPSDVKDESSINELIGKNEHGSKNDMNNGENANNVSAEKRKVMDSSAMINEQHEAAMKYRNMEVRKYREEIVEIETSSGEILKTKMWVTEGKPKADAKKEIEIFVCDVCKKEFDKRQKLLLHARYHK
ncbi:hypothetical protein ENBRE01_0207 [Enteropsectra breve]|nr:hypothetical protein ENBRE01_0207 [Enteropsectra breve]